MTRNLRFDDLNFDVRELIVSKSEPENLKLLKKKKINLQKEINSEIKSLNRLQNKLMLLRNTIKFYILNKYKYEDYVMNELLAVNELVNISNNRLLKLNEEMNEINTEIHNEINIPLTKMILSLSKNGGKISKSKSTKSKSTKSKSTKSKSTKYKSTKYK